MKLPTTLVLLALSTLASCRKPPNSVLLSQVKSLTLYDNKPTSHRRVSAIPQLKCIGGNAKGLYSVDVMRCKNSGSEYDSEDIQWTCTASLPPEFKLGSTDVICEGYDSPDDPYILKGSCGVQYRLMLTELGEQKFGKNGRKFRSKKSGAGGDGEGESIAGDVFTVLFWLAFVGIAVLIVSRILTPLFGGGGPGNRRRPGFGGGGGWGRGDGPDDPPPPYTPRGAKSSSSYRSNSSRASSSNAEGWRPGFWSGAATGAAAAYAFGNRNTNRGQRGYDRAEGQAGPSNWFGGRSNNNGTGARTSSDSGSTPSSSRYESTGFGGTSRR